MWGSRPNSPPLKISKTPLHVPYLYPPRDTASQSAFVQGHHADFRSHSSDPSIHTSPPPHSRRLPFPNRQHPHPQHNLQRRLHNRGYQTKLGARIKRSNLQYRQLNTRSFQYTTIGLAGTISLRMSSKEWARSDAAWYAECLVTAAGKQASEAGWV